MLWLLADNANNPLTADHNTFITDFLNGWTNFHKEE